MGGHRPEEHITDLGIRERRRQAGDREKWRRLLRDAKTQKRM
jgi:hypothetical protein